MIVATNQHDRIRKTKKYGEPHGPAGRHIQDGLTHPGEGNAIKGNAMFFRNLDENTVASLTIPQYADELFALTEQNREFLSRWLPWLDSVRQAADTRDFILLQLTKLSMSEALHETIFYKGRAAGVLGYNQIDRGNGIGVIGYWLAEEFNGNGIMTLAVKDLISLGFEYFQLQKVEIACAVGNLKSRAIPERLGFKNEGTLRRTEKVGGGYLDMVIYGLLREEFKG
jgi:ribosomal-protein-serine acetyltransferase